MVGPSHWNPQIREHKVLSQELRPTNSGAPARNRMAGFPREMAALVRQNNAVAIAQRLVLSSGDTSKRQFVDYMKTKSYATVLSESERVMSADWAEVVCHAIKAAIGVNDKNLMEAYTHQEASVEAFLRIFKALTRQWLPVLKQLLIDLRRLGDQVRRP